VPPAGQNIGLRSADVLQAIPGATVNVVERCLAVDGTWGFKTPYFDLSMKVTQPLFDAVRAVVGEFEAGHSDEERGKLAAVHFVRFALPDVARRAFAGAEVGLTVDHPGDRGRTVLTPAARRLAEDLA
jgi:hypothetical protein